MPHYVAPVDPQDIVLLSYLHKSPGLWVVCVTAAPGVRGVYGVWKSWRRAAFFANTIGPTANVYFCNGTDWYYSFA